MTKGLKLSARPLSYWLIRRVEIEKAIAAVAVAQQATAVAQQKTEKTVNRMGRYAMVIARDHEGRLAALESDELDSDE